MVLRAAGGRAGFRRRGGKAPHFGRAPKRLGKAIPGRSGAKGLSRSDCGDPAHKITILVQINIYMFARGQAYVRTEGGAIALGGKGGSVRRLGRFFDLSPQSLNLA
jgi:hypothetical protein